MDFRQRVQDIVLLLKQDRKAQVIAIVVIIFLMWGLFGNNNRPRRGAGQPQEIVLSGGSMGGQEAYEDLVTRIGGDLKEIGNQVEKNASATNELKSNMELYEKRVAEIFQKLLVRMADLESRVASQGDQVAAPQDVVGEELDDLGEPGLSPWGDIKTAEVAPPKEPERERIALIGAGDSVRVRLIAGVNAPTDGTPYPTVFKLMSPVEGPDGSSLPLGEARLIAAAQGSLSDQRALFRLTSLNIRYPDGSKKVLDVDGWIVGEDGIRGMEGILVDPLGKVLMGALVAGTVEGAGQATAQSQTTNFTTDEGTTFSYIDGDTLDYALGRGIGKAGSRWGSIIDERAKQLIPHVKVLSGRSATAVFSKNIQVAGLYDALKSEEFAFTALD